MGNIFSGLEALGLGKLSKMDIYEKEEAKKREASVKKEKVVMLSEEDYIFDKTYTCPACDKTFKSKTVKAGKAKLQSLDTDLRPKYVPLDPLKYDVVLCPHCGFSALNRFFKYLTPTQIGRIKEQITASFKGIEEKNTTISYEDAMLRHKLALVNSIVKKAKTSERAYTCLKTAWVIRGKIETLTEDQKTSDENNLVSKLRQEENEFLQKAYEGFLEAFGKETFPMCGMDENTTTLLAADLARRLGRNNESSRWLSKLLVARDASDRIKEKAREIRELLKNNVEGSE